MTLLGHLCALLAFTDCMYIMANYTAYPTANKTNARKSIYVNSEAKIKAQAFIRVDIYRLRVYNTT